jgi:hypothetical protein
MNLQHFYLATVLGKWRENKDFVAHKLIPMVWNSQDGEGCFLFTISQGERVYNINALLNLPTAYGKCRFDGVRGQWGLYSFKEGMTLVQRGSDDFPPCAEEVLSLLDSPGVEEQGERLSRLYTPYSKPEPDMAQKALFAWKDCWTPELWWAGLWPEGKVLPLVRTGEGTGRLLSKEEAENFVARTSGEGLFYLQAYLARYTQDESDKYEGPVSVDRWLFD